MAEPEPYRPSIVPRDLELLGRGVLSNLSKPVAIARLLTPTTQFVSRTVTRAREGTAMAAPFSAPRTSFNGTITGHRSVGVANMSLEDVKAIKNATGTTVNDVVLAVTGGALQVLAGRPRRASGDLVAGQRAGLGA